MCTDQRQCVCCTALHHTITAMSWLTVKSVTTHHPPPPVSQCVADTFTKKKSCVAFAYSLHTAMLVPSGHVTPSVGRRAPPRHRLAGARFFLFFFFFFCIISFKRVTKQSLDANSRHLPVWRAEQITTSPY